MELGASDGARTCAVDDRVRDVYSANGPVVERGPSSDDERGRGRAGQRQMALQSGVSKFPSAETCSPAMRHGFYRTDPCSASPRLSGLVCLYARPRPSRARPSSSIGAQGPRYAVGESVLDAPQRQVRNQREPRPQQQQGSCKQAPQLHNHTCATRRELSPSKQL